MPLKKIISLFFALFISLLISFFAFADTIIIDCSDDNASYRETVAALNQYDSYAAVLSSQMNDENNEPDIAAEEPVLVLCKTCLGSLSLGELEPLMAVMGSNGYATLLFSSQAQADHAVAVLSARDDILYAECDAMVFAAAVQDTDTAINYSFHSWAASAMNYSDYINYTKQYKQGYVLVAVVDSGIGYHPILNSRIRYLGYDYVDLDGDPRSDQFGHGTQVAGIIADCSQDLPVYLAAIRVLNSGGGGTVSNLVNGIREAVESGASIINLSLQTSVISAALDDAVTEALNHGALVVLAAGNHATDTSKISPAHITDPGMIVVGAAAASGDGYSRASYSNYGSSVDLYVPGTGISCALNGGGYISKTGTSMSAPHVAALCAMLKLLHPGLSASAIEKRVILSLKQRGSVSIPDLDKLIPSDIGFCLDDLSMCLGESITLSQAAYPASSLEINTFSVEDSSILSIDHGVITARQAGETVVTVSCFGLEDISFNVHVEPAEEQEAIFYLPASLKTLGSEALSGVNARHVVLPDGLQVIEENVLETSDSIFDVVLPSSVNEIGNNSFSNATILVSYQSYAYTYVKEHRLNYIIQVEQ